MLKIIKEKLPQGCIFIEKSDLGPTTCPLDNNKIKLGLQFLEGMDGVIDDSYVLIDKKILDKTFLNVISNLISKEKYTENKLRFDGDVVVLKENDDNSLVSLDLDDDYSILGEKVAGKLTNLSFSEVENFANFPDRGDGSPILVKTVGGGYKSTGESYFDKLDKRNESLRKWNRDNKKFLEENNIPYAPEEKHDFIEGVKKAHALTSSVSGVIGDVGSAIDAWDKIQAWWEKRKINKSYEREEEINRKKVMERNRLSSMFLRSRLKKVEDDGFESMAVLTSIYNMGFSNILNAPHYFNPDYLKVLLSICSICVANALPPNRIINTKMNISQLSALYHKLEGKYGKAV